MRDPSSKSSTGQTTTCLLVSFQWLQSTIIGKYSSCFCTLGIPVGAFGLTAY